MNFHEYQAAAIRTAPTQGQTDGLVNAACGMCKESGEFMSVIYRVDQYGKDLSDDMRNHMVEEAGDILWYLALACEHLGVSLQAVAKHNIGKLLTNPDARYPGGVFDPAAAEARADKGGLGHRES